MKGKHVLGFWFLLAMILVFGACAQPMQLPVVPEPAEMPEEEAMAADFEIWALDQADTRPDQGGVLYIWSGDAKAGDAAEVIDLAEAAEAAGCPPGKRPHMALPNHSDPPTHVVIANVGSGLVYFMDPDTRKVVGCVSTREGFNGAGGSAQSHAANATPDNSMVIVADIGGRDADGNPRSGWLHKIQTDYATNTFTLVETLSLEPFAEALGTKVARPICHEFTGDSRFVYVTFAGGGVLVADVGSADGSTPMEVVHVYPASMVPGVGCGAFRLDDGRMLTNSASTSNPDPVDGDYLYVFDATGLADGKFPDPIQITLPGADAHGLQICEDPEGNLFAWVLMRVSNEITIVDLQTNTVVDTLALARDFSPNPAPDIGFIRGGKYYMTLRGPEPLTAITKFKEQTRTPGIAVLEVAEDCRSFKWEEEGLLRVADVTVIPPDPHGMAIVDH